MPNRTNKLKILRTGDLNSAFSHAAPHEILDQFGSPSYLLGSSTKLDKCPSVGVFARVLYLTPGIFCPAASKACLSACLGHTSGRMRLPINTTARDKRTALYLIQPDYFMARLSAELHLLKADAQLHGLRAAVRLNGTSDLAWERLHPELFDTFADIQFFDYTKLRHRMLNFLGTGSADARKPWPANYHLTFSAESDDAGAIRKVAAAGGNTAVCFWPELPTCWLGLPVIDGDAHDARFLDPQPSIVGLKAKGLAQVDVSGFTVRICPNCQSSNDQLDFVCIWQFTHRHTVHRCVGCGFELRARHKLVA